MRARLFPGLLLALATACSGEITAPKVPGPPTSVHQNGHGTVPGTLDFPPTITGTTSTDTTTDSGHGFGSGG